MAGKLIRKSFKTDICATNVHWCPWGAEQRVKTAVQLMQLPFSLTNPLQMMQYQSETLLSRSVYKSQSFNMQMAGLRLHFKDPRAVLKFIE